MSSVNNRYDIYIDRTIQLAETICVHLVDVADAINNAVYLNTLVPVTSTDKTTWKYYQNICGIYYNTDTIMYVTSLDTQNVIEFNQANLAIHIETCKAYQYNSRHYKDLVQSYPDQEMLILGILYPADMDQAINAKDGQILSYPGFMLDDNEYTLIPQLQEWIYSYLFRWTNKQYTITDNLYVANYIAQLFLHMVPAIYNIRLAACHTNAANSYHVIEYLASHNYLNTDYDYMDDYQRMFFYRNIRVIERNAGMQSTFNWLVDNVMTERGLPLYAYTAKHAITPPTTTPTVTNSLPTVYFERASISGYSDTGVNNYTLDELLTSTVPLANDNLLEQTYNEAAINNKLILSKYDSMQTKELQSSVTDYSEVAPVSLTSILINHWPYLAFNGTYTAVIPITMPDSTVVTMSAQNAFILYSYILFKLTGHDTLYPSTWMCDRVVYNNINTATQIANITDSTYTDPIVAAAMVSLIPTVTPMLSIDSFNVQCTAIYNGIINQYFLYNSYMNSIERGELKAVSYLPFADCVIDTGINSLNIQEWLSSLNLDLSTYTDTQLYTLSNNVIQSALGLDLNTNITLAETQAAMIDVFLKLSSYSVQIISESNKADLTLIPSDFVSINLIDTTVSEEIAIEQEQVSITNQQITTLQTKEIELVDLIEFSNFKSTESSTINIPLNCVNFTVPNNKLDYTIFNLSLPFFEINITESVVS